MTQPPPGRIVQLAAAAAAVAPMAAVYAWMHGPGGMAPDLATFFLGPLLVGGGMIFWLAFLHLVWCRDRLSSLGLRRPGLIIEISAGAVLGLLLLGLKRVTDPFLYRLLEPRPPSETVLALLEAVARDPVLLALWLGPVLWIGIAGFEELWRAVMLRRLQAALPGRTGQVAAVLGVSLLVGFAHAYQGPAGIVSIGLKSVLMGGLFLASGRVRFLIVAHAVYDGVQIVAAVLMIRQGA